MPIHRNIEEDQSLDAVIEVDVLENSRKPIFHVFANTEFLLVNGLDLHELVLVVEAK